MARQPDVQPDAQGAYSILMRAGFMYTATSQPAPPARSPPKPLPEDASASPVFPLPLAESFADARLDAMPRYFNNYEGSFSVGEDALTGARALKQWVTRPPLVWHFADDEPLAIVAPGWANYVISAAARLDLGSNQNGGRGYADPRKKKLEPVLHTYGSSVQAILMSA